MTHISVLDGMCMTAKWCERDLHGQTEMDVERTSPQGSAWDSSLEKELIEFEFIWKSKEIILPESIVLSVGLILYLKSNRQTESNTHSLL